MLDVAILGAGVIGSVVARELSRYKLEVAVFERGFDVASGASKANSGIVHGGYDAQPGTLKAKYNSAGNPLFDELAFDLDFPFRRNGSLVIAFAGDDPAGLDRLLERGRRNGVLGLKIIDRDEILRREPHIGNTVVRALDVPTGGIVCPYEMTIAFAENAAANGVKFHFGHQVDSLEKLGAAGGNEGFRIFTNQGVYAAKAVVNAAGLYSDLFHNLFAKDKLNIQPRRGEYFLLDRSENGLVRHTIFQLPGEKGKGVLVTPTVDGNILCGPTSDDITDKENVATTEAGLGKILELASRDLDALPLGKTITSFAGLRAHETTKRDFSVGAVIPGLPNFFDAVGIESPGLTSAPALGADLARMVVEYLKPQTNGKFQPQRRATPRFRHMSLEEKEAAIKRDPNYGHLVCRCEAVTKAEVLGALRSPLGVYNLDGIKRRTRAGMGRCQGGFCSMRLPEIVAAEMGVPLTVITKRGGESRLLLCKNKAAWQEA